MKGNQQIKQRNVLLQVMVTIYKEAIGEEICVNAVTPVLLTSQTSVGHLLTSYISVVLGYLLDIKWPLGKGKIWFHIVGTAIFANKKFLCWPFFLGGGPR